MTAPLWEAVAAEHADLDAELEQLLDAAIPGRREEAAWRALTLTAKRDRPNPLIPQRRPLPACAVAIPLDRKALR